MMNIYQINASASACTDGPCLHTSMLLTEDADSFGSPQLLDVKPWQSVCRNDKIDSNTLELNSHFKMMTK